MQYSEGSIGRIFTIRLEDGDQVPVCIEQFAKDHEIKAGLCTLIGGIDKGNIVVGPKDGNEFPPDPMLHAIDAAHEAAAIGTIFPGENGEPVLHMHAALGREGKTRTGCIRPGLDIWLVGEVVIIEILNTDMLRKKDPKSGFALLAKG